MSARFEAIHCPNSSQAILKLVPTGETDGGEVDGFDAYRSVALDLLQHIAVKRVVAEYPD